MLLLLSCCGGTTSLDERDGGVDRSGDGGLDGDEALVDDGSNDADQGHEADTTPEADGDTDDPGLPSCSNFPEALEIQLIETLPREPTWLSPAPDLVLDSNEEPLITYTCRVNGVTSFVSQRVGGEWIEDEAPSTYGYVSIAGAVSDGGDGLHIAARLEGPSESWLMSWNLFSGWELADQLVGFGFAGHGAVVQAGRVLNALAFQRGSGLLHLGHHDGTWSFDLIEGAGEDPGPCALAVSHTGSLQAACWNNSPASGWEVFWMDVEGGVEQVFDVDWRTFNMTAAAVDLEITAATESNLHGQPHIIIDTNLNSGWTQLVYLRRDGPEDWTLFVVAEPRRESRERDSCESPAMSERCEVDYDVVYDVALAPRRSGGVWIFYGLHHYTGMLHSNGFEWVSNIKTEGSLVLAWVDETDQVQRCVLYDGPFPLSGDAEVGSAGAVHLGLFERRAFLEETSVTYVIAGERE